MAGAAGIGVFIAFVGAKDSGFISAAPYPTLLQLNTEWPYKTGGCQPARCGYDYLRRGCRMLQA